MDVPPPTLDLSADSASNAVVVFDITPAQWKC